MIYGFSKSKDILLSSIAGELNENIKKAYTIDSNNCDLVMDSLGDNPVFLINNSDIVKPKGKKFEDLGIVREVLVKTKNIKVDIIIQK